MLVLFPPLDLAQEALLFLFVTMSTHVVTSQETWRGPGLGT